MVTDLADYPWSSYLFHGLGEPDALLGELPALELWGPEGAKRRRQWRRWVHKPLTGKELDALRKSVTSGRPYGSAAWAKAAASRLGLRLSQRPRGRPRNEPEK